MSIRNENVCQSNMERASIASLSRRKIVDAYANWTEVSKSEALCVDLVLDSRAVVLDLGCGAGRLANWINGSFRSYIGIDASKPMIETAQRNYPELTFMVADILEYEAAESSLDVILLMGNVLDCLHPHERRSALLERCFRWLRPGGSIVGSSHLTNSAQQRGYYSEDYHGAQLHQFRSSASEMVAEVESFGFELSLLTRDYRKQPADWANWVATRPSESQV